MDLTNTKYWTSISLDGIKKAKEKAPKKFQNSEKYGNQMSADVKFWEDGNASISVSYQDANGTWERIHIGSIRISNNQQTSGAGNTTAPAGGSSSEGDSDFPF